MDAISLSDQIDALTAEALDMIPRATSGRGSFSLGASKRTEDAWQADFLAILDGKLLQDAFRPDVDEIGPLIQAANLNIFLPPLRLILGEPPGPTMNIPTTTLQAIVNYTIFELLIRRLIPIPAKNQPNDLAALLRKFETLSSVPEAAVSLGALDKRMGLYERLKEGRNLMLHGNLTHSFEGMLLAWLIDVVILHVMKQSLAGTSQAASARSRQ